jgi:hypothetical protein
MSETRNDPNDQRPKCITCGRPWEPNAGVDATTERCGVCVGTVPDVWKLLDKCRVGGDNIGGTEVAFAYEALSRAVTAALRMVRESAYACGREDERKLANLARLEALRLAESEKAENATAVEILASCVKDGVLQMRDVDRAKVYGEHLGGKLRGKKT